MSANSGPIQAPAPGFLSLMEMKNSGHNPDLLIGTVQPVVNMEPWWLRGERQPIGAIAAPALVAGYNAVTVLGVQDGWRYVSFVGGTIDLDISSAVNVVVFAQSPTSLEIGDIFNPGITLATDGVSPLTAVYGAREFWLQPGYALMLGVYVSGTLTGTSPVSVLGVPVI